MRKDRPLSAHMALLLRDMNYADPKGGYRMNSDTASGQDKHRADLLEDRGFVYSTPHKLERTVRLWFLTDAGKAALLAYDAARG